MKKIFVYYLLVTYLLAMLKPVMPVIQDELAHIFWRLEHIATVHHQHGNDHVHTEVQEADEEDEKEAHSSSLKSQEPVSAHLLLKINLEFPSIHSPGNFGIHSNARLLTAALAIIIPPPKVG